MKFSLVKWNNYTLGVSGSPEGSPQRCNSIDQSTAPVIFIEDPNMSPLLFQRQDEGKHSCPSRRRLAMLLTCSSTGMLMATKITAPGLGLLVTISPSSSSLCNSHTFCSFCSFFLSDFNF
ncbi:uncharacterized protein LOC131246199 [Magnolia sinica]|uniref:uncharacterized protein LOC131246199 n=1 Tax=Magnolia sinica TaxID=86752 RepID=UPI0026586E8E|nr:uncharacterized protein LOC131246199 [Magnolia sinica]